MLSTIRRLALAAILALAVSLAVSACSSGGVGDPVQPQGPSRALTVPGDTTGGEDPRIMSSGPAVQDSTGTERGGGTVGSGN